MRSVVFDSSVHKNSAYFVGGVAGERFTIPVNIITYGDVQISFFLHNQGTNNLQQRELAFFITFNTSFYFGSEGITFKKNCIDMLKKDSQNKSSDSTFEVLLGVSYSPSCFGQMKTLHKFRKLIACKGSDLTCSKGTEIISEGSKNHKLYLVLDGAVEGVVIEQANVASEAHCHPFGLSRPSSKEGSYVPITGIVGKNSVFGCSQFLNRGTSMTYRVRTERLHAAVIDIDIESIDDKDSKGIQFDSGTVMLANSIGTLKSWSFSELALLFVGLSLHLAIKLAFIKNEGFRLSAQREFDHCDILDDVELLRLNILNQFVFPITEKILFSAKCFCKSDSNTSRRIRLIALKKHIVLDSEVFGPTVSASSEIIYFTEVHNAT
jgi:hypothetical protein